MQKLISLLVLVLLYGCSKEDVQPKDFLFLNHDPYYPTTFRKLRIEEIEAKQKELEAGQFTFSLIDSFGFVSFSYEDDFEARRQLHKPLISYVNSLITCVKQYLVEKQQFTGITDTAQLVPQKTNTMFLDFGGYYQQSDSNSYNHLGINFGKQKIDGLEVYNSLLSISATANGVHRIFGHWYSEVLIPVRDQVTVELAKSILNGRTLTAYNGWGEVQHYVISKEHITKSRKIIYPLVTTNQLELRVCWEFTLLNWLIMMDTTTGEVVAELDTSFHTF